MSGWLRKRLEEIRLGIMFSLFPHTVSDRSPEVTERNTDNAATNPDEPIFELIQCIFIHAVVPLFVPGIF